MLGSTRAIRVFARAAPTDLRNGFNGLYGLIRNELGRDPLSGDLFLFVNRRRTSAKVMYWDGTGLCIYSKRLARGRFACLWSGASGEPLRLTRAELNLFMEGARLEGKLPISPEEVKL